YETDRNAAPGIYFPVGYQEFDGSDALAYVRTRRYSSDYSRMGRQRCVIAAMADQLDPASLLRGLPRLLSTFEENVDTDIPFDLLPDLIRLLGVVDMDNAIAVGFTPPDWTIGPNRPDIPRIREAVALAITDPAAAVELFSIEVTGSSCGPG
ncbi:MAG: LCP family protein, partial [Acidimicrobiia bacterium]|nr:LCP family protein [Acidimicrobiia bacterium]